MKFFYCKKCLMPSTRPRLTFDKDGVCDACEWEEIKKTTVDWEKRRADLHKLCDNFRRDDMFDVIVPCSGGKDGSYVAWKLKHEFGMHPLCVTFATPMPSELGKRNLERFIASGFNHIQINPNPDVYKALNKRGFIQDGYPKRGFVAGLAPAITKIAIGLNIKFVMWGEDEKEYGGAWNCYSPDYKIKYADFLNGDDFCGKDPSSYLDQFNKKDFYWWLMPSQEEMDQAELYQTYWSRFEPWDDELHRKLAVEKCGLEGNKDANVSTFTTHSQVDDIMQPFFMYMAFVKFGFGRATADCGLAIRLGRMTREEAVEIVKKYEGEFPEKDLPALLDYFEMTEQKFWKVIDSFVNKKILEKVDGCWKLKKDIHFGLDINNYKDV